MSLKPRIRVMLAAAIWLAALTVAPAQLANSQLFVERAQKAFDLAQKNYLADTNSAAAARELARASVDVADLATNNVMRAEFARTGIAVCRHWLARESNSAPGHYYLAMNLGKLAEAEAPSLAAYRLVNEMEREFKSAAELDVHFDYAGPARTLGELYFQAPGWPFSVGSKRKAREWLERAAALAPEYPENQLNLAEAQLKWREPQAFAATMKILDARWPAAKTNFTGVAREADWLDWNARRAALTAEFQKTYKRAPGS
jgi:hypothetical protein